MPPGDPRGTLTRRLWIAAAVALLILLIWFAVRAWRQSRTAPLADAVSPAAAIEAPPVSASAPA